ncbi:hypothetical protein CPB83DRAFT_850674 [Crepidotus variabilis]|uniref:C2H2-type domain-containing protein n=1 Tax=Crepidotus variabilis TaxID=179855 RepID=A0A9P6JRC9_9AGAR|nr:hypothetical protein CPB83DRAFT_850674 [Crepidotus variabilis]
MRGLVDINLTLSTASPLRPYVVPTLFFCILSVILSGTSMTEQKKYLCDRCREKSFDTEQGLRVHKSRHCKGPTNEASIRFPQSTWSCDNGAIRFG